MKFDAVLLVFTISYVSLLFDTNAAAFTCPEVSTTPANLHPDPQDCGYFYQCVGTIAYHMPCPANLYFNPTLYVCDWSQSAGCEVTTDTCDDMPCQNGGECFEVEGGYKCYCEVGFTGTNCESQLNVRLAGGVTPNEGRVELLYSGVWGTMCNDLAGDTEARVVCRQLGFNDGVALTSDLVEDGSGPIWLDDVNCSGGEASIFDCSHLPIGTNNCQHSQDFGVQCSSDL